MSPQGAEARAFIDPRYQQRYRGPRLEAPSGRNIVKLGELLKRPRNTSRDSWTVLSTRYFIYGGTEVRGDQLLI
jgi:hypothetical protein